jgi:hypothetical protein
LKVLLGFVIGIMVIVVIAVIVLGYFGFMPGVSNLFGSNRPRDLGVTFTAADYQSAKAKQPSVISDLPAGAPAEQSLKFSGGRGINTTFTQAEFNALLNNRQWEYYPLKDCQLRINQNGTAEFSAILLKDRLTPFARAMGISESDIKVLNDILRWVPTSPAVYAMGTVTVSNGQISNANISDFQVGKLSLTGQAQDNISRLRDLAQTLMSEVPGFSCQSFKFVNGQVQFQGTIPDVARSKAP